MTRRIAIVGAGVLGSAIAWRLATAGHAVTLFDPDPGAMASAGSLAWLNASFAEDPVYNRLRHDSLQLWKSLKDRHPALPIAFDGAILWQQDHFDLPAILAAQQTLGRPATMLDRTAHLAREPGVPAPPAQSLALDGDAYGSPGAITGWFLDQARANGAVLLAKDVQTILTENGMVTGLRTDHGTHDADHVVLAAGVRLHDLLAAQGLGLAMDNKPGLLVTTTPAGPGSNAMLATDGLHGWQGDDGRYLIGADFGGGDPVDDPDAFAHRLVARLASLIPAASDCTVERMTVRERPMPADGRPAVGPLGPGGLYVVSTHSGMTLAPVIAQMVAHEIGADQPDPRLTPYRPDRPALRVQGGFAPP